MFSFAKWRNFNPLDKFLLFLLVAMAIVAFSIAACPKAHAMGPLTVAAHICQWDREPDANKVTGYYVYWRTAGTTAWSNNQRSPIVPQPPVGTVPSFELLNFNLPTGTYDICATALDAAGNESGPSNSAPFSPAYPASPQNFKIPLPLPSTSR